MIDIGIVNTEGIVRPITVLPDLTWNNGMRQFGAKRDNGTRLHAGCDIYAPIGTPIYSMMHGKVIMGYTEYYKGTYSITIDHGAFIARYCEINKPENLIPVNTIIESGQQIATVSKIEGMNLSMLHLEVFEGYLIGPYKDLNNPPYMRRKDLINFTKALNNIYQIHV